MIHGKGPDGQLLEQSQDYDVHGRVRPLTVQFTDVSTKHSQTIYAVDRAGLNKRLLDILEEMPNVKLFFNHKLTGADFARCKAWIEVKAPEPVTGRAKEIEVDFDLMIGADGAHSAVRYHLMKFTRMDYHQEYIDTLWCEFQIRPRKVPKSDDPLGRFKISPNHLHIWPGKDFMFIAIPSEDGSFTCTLFLPSGQFAALESDPAGLPAFFNKSFPGVTDLIPPGELIASFNTNPHLPLISIKCRPYHYSASAVVIGDAAHAMVPFYGQGMNAGLEDVRILFSVLDKHSLAEGNSPTEEATDWASPEYQRILALEEYTAVRVPDAHAINDLALQNYVEMRASVLSPRYRLRKFLEEKMSVYLPSLGWQTKYSRVSFGNERYSEVVAKSDHQGKVLMRSFLALASSPVFVAAILLYWNRRRLLRSDVAGSSLIGIWKKWRNALG